MPGAPEHVVAHPGVHLEVGARGGPECADVRVCRHQGRLPALHLRLRRRHGRPRVLPAGPRLHPGLLRAALPDGERATAPPLHPPSGGLAARRRPEVGARRHHQLGHRQARRPEGGAGRAPVEVGPAKAGRAAGGHGCARGGAPRVLRKNVRHVSGRPHAVLRARALARRRSQRVHQPGRRRRGIAIRGYLAERLPAVLGRAAVLGGRGDRALRHQGGEHPAENHQRRTAVGDVGRRRPRPREECAAAGVRGHARLHPARDLADGEVVPEGRLLRARRGHVPGRLVQARRFVHRRRLRSG
mmetsp:Transcript_100506/g.288803  ORF Transcript_100506/g.288803 Transcript_100506/m.288803 type:complete len:300 (-) Transcript_100506:362-1261(-)